MSDEERNWVEVHSDYYATFFKLSSNVGFGNLQAIVYSNPSKGSHFNIEARSSTNGHGDVVADIYLSDRQVEELIVMLSYHLQKKKEKN